MSDNQQIVEASSGVLASKVITYSGSAGGALAWMASLDVAFWFSVFIGLVGLIMNWYFARKKDKRDEIEHQAFLENLKIKGKADVE
ncbi:holin [Acinetobacter soli]|uniref:holin n=1 Tax=Acinetobacter soli TaxID=487316 RepID=UPI00124FB9EA|nr:holin [Acinetobacter soli]